MNKSYTVALANGRFLLLPIVDIGKGLAISLLMCNSITYSVVDLLVADLADLAAPYKPDAVVGIPEQGIPLVHGVGRLLGLRRSYLFRKTPKVFDTKPCVVSYNSVTKAGEQSLYLSEEDASALRGKKVAIIEDVINTGSTVKAAIQLLRMAHVADIRVFVVLTEGEGWYRSLKDDVGIITNLGHIPLFKPSGYESI